VKITVLLKIFHKDADDSNEFIWRTINGKKVKIKVSSLKDLSCLNEIQLRKILILRIKNGDYTLNIKTSKQNQHIEKFHKDYLKNSYLLNKFSELSENQVIDIVKNAIKNGKPLAYGNSIRISFKYTEKIGMFVNKENETPTSKMLIHFSKQGFHIVPTEY